jgi:hypothetical protein
MGVPRVGRIAVALGAVMAASWGVSAFSVAQSGDHKPSASELVERDPGKRVGGNTIVATGNDEHVLGVPDRPNFIIALGSGDMITGGSKNSELGALGEDDTIVADRSHELIVAGPHGKVIVSGSGHDLVVDTHPGGTIELESAHDEVIATGRDDHIICTRAAVHDTIYDNKSDTVNRRCHKNHDPVHPVASSVLARDFAAPVAHSAATVSGDGSNDNQYTAPCDNSAAVDCSVSSFASRTLSGLWANEYVPAYKCPGNHPYLLGQGYAPAGTYLPLGVEVQGLGPIGVSITATSSYASHSAGTLTGGTNSSATNWTFGTNSYKVILHCTSDQSHGAVYTGQ